jgi:uncharacterized protein (TIGR02271 family)
VFLFAQPARAEPGQLDPADLGDTRTPSIFVGANRVRGPAIIEKERIFVPVRGVFEAIEATVEYAPPQFVVVRKDGAVIAAFMLDRTRAIVGHRAVELESAPMRRDGTVYVPLRVVAEAAGASVSFTSRPPVVHIMRPGMPDGADDLPLGAAMPPAVQDAEPQTPEHWVLGVATATGLCALSCIFFLARRFGPLVFRSRKRAAAAPARAPAAVSMPPSDKVALTSVESSGEARFRKEVVTETRTIQVPVTREELVIEYVGEGGSVIIEGRQLATGETVRIPLWEERVHIDVTKHAVVTEDILIGKRLVTAPGPLPDREPADFTLAEGSPS